MKKAKKTTWIAAPVLFLLCSCSGLQFRGDFPPRVDLFLAKEFTEGPARIGEELGSLGEREWKNFKNFPAELLDTIRFLIGI